MSLNSSLLRTARHSSKPSIHDMFTSIRITSGRSTCKVEISRRPLAACATSKPSWRSASAIISRVSRSSSTMITLGFFGSIAEGLERDVVVLGGRLGGARGGGGSGGSAGRPGPRRWLRWLGRRRRRRGVELQGHRAGLAVAVGELLDAPLRLLEDLLAPVHQPHPLLEGAERILQRELAALEPLHQLLQPVDDLVVL